METGEFHPDILPQIEVQRARATKSRAAWRNTTVKSEMSNDKRLF
jgi:hypothetical protein